MGKGSMGMGVREHGEGEHLGTWGWGRRACEWGCMGVEVGNMGKESMGMGMRDIERNMGMGEWYYTEKGK
jgi:hypothetical protein